MAIIVPCGLDESAIKPKETNPLVRLWLRGRVWVLKAMLAQVKRDEERIANNYASHPAATIAYVEDEDAEDGITKTIERLESRL